MCEVVLSLVEGIALQLRHDKGDPNCEAVRAQAVVLRVKVREQRPRAKEVLLAMCRTDL